MPKTRLRSANTSTKSSEPGPQHDHFRANSRTFLSTFLGLVLEPGRFAPLVVDYWLLVQSAWSNKRESGPDVVYPMLGIRKRQSGRLARLILDHSRDCRSYELRAVTKFPKGIDPPSVAVIDLDQVPREVVENGYSTKVNLYGHMCMLMLIEIMITLSIHLFYSGPFWGWVAWMNWGHSVIINWCLFSYAVVRGDGILTLARRSKSAIPSYAVLLDPDFSVILKGSQSVVEAVTENSFNLSQPNPVWALVHEEDQGPDSGYHVLQSLCEGICLTTFALLGLFFLPSTTRVNDIVFIITCLIAAGLQKSPPNHFTSMQRTWFSAKQLYARAVLPMFVITSYERLKIQNSASVSDWCNFAHFIPLFLLALFSDGYRARNYPIRRERLLDALGRPQVKKWQFDTLAAAATFQCLVLCRGLSRPVRRIEVLAFLDMLVPDQRDVWTVWKERVADRIVHEVDVHFAPTIPMFGDERQKQLRDLLVQAQFAHIVYKLLYR